MKIKLTNPAGIIDEEFQKSVPVRQYYNDAGADVFSPIEVVVMPGETKRIGLGFGIQMPDGFMGMLMPKSGLSSEGIFAQVPPIDPGYTGEINVVLYNSTKENRKFEKGHKLAQLVIVPVIIPELVVELGEERGNGGFGSTGK